MGPTDSRRTSARLWTGSSVPLRRVILRPLYNLGYLYQFGEGVPMDPVKAERLYKLAATLGHREALDASDSS